MSGIGVAVVVTLSGRVRRLCQDMASFSSELADTLAGEAGDQGA